jgi:predicted nucleotidyltransferase
MLIILKYRSCPGDTSLGRYNKAPRMRIQKAENVNKALEFINSRGVKLTNIGPEGMQTDSSADRSDIDLKIYTRYHRWKLEAHSWYDMDPYSSIHDRRYQACLSFNFLGNNY